MLPMELGWLLRVDWCARGGQGTPSAHIFGNAAEAQPALLSREVPLGPHAAWLLLHPFVPEQRSLKVTAAQILALLPALIENQFVLLSKRSINCFPCLSPAIPSFPRTFVKAVLSTLHTSYSFPFPRLVCVLADAT